MADVGRPTVMTDIVIGKLEEAFSLGCTDAESCFYAGIAKDTLYEYQTKNPDFTDRKEALKESPIFKARKSVVDAMPNDPELSLKYLERKKKDEFSPRSESINTHSFTQMPSVKVGENSVELKFNVGEEK